MKLSLAEPFKSIKQFKEIEIPDFTVLTGKNGSGKTHILQAIQDSNPHNTSSINIENLQRDKIKYFNFQTFLINSQSEINKQQIDVLKEQAWQLLLGQRLSFKNIDNELKKFKTFESQPYDQKSDEEQNASEQYFQHKDMLKRMLDQFSSNGAEVKSLIKSAIYSSGKYASEIERNDFYTYADISPEDYALSNNLSQIFHSYRSKINTMKLQALEGGKNFDPAVEENAPWNIINKLLETFSLKHKVTTPTFEKIDMINGQPTFLAQLTLNDDIIAFSDLSSGEKVLCALAVSIYQGNKNLSLPEVLLLDEVDASLHPSMIKNLLDTISDVFVSKGCKVILATHSPTTVSLVGEESLYEVKKDNVLEKIVKISKKDAIEILSEGIITLDDALLFIGDIFKSELTIVSEGKNFNYIQKAIDILNPEVKDRVTVYKYEKTAGKGDSHVGSLYSFVSEISTRNKKVLFVVDCDSENVLGRDENSQTFHFTFSRIIENTICKKGIENAMSSKLFTIEFLAEESEFTKFKNDSDNKNDFYYRKVKDNNNKDDFSGFQGLMTKINSLLMKL